MVDVADGRGAAHGQEPADIVVVLVQNPTEAATSRAGRFDPDGYGHAGVVQIGERACAADGDLVALAIEADCMCADFAGDPSGTVDQATCMTPTGPIGRYGA